METLQTGNLAYLDTFAGLVPCKVLAVYHDKQINIVRADVKLTATRQAYKRGETVTGQPAFHVIPRKAVKRGKYSSVILPYEYQTDTQTKTK